MEQNLSAQSILRRTVRTPQQQWQQHQQSPTAATNSLRKQQQQVADYYSFVSPYWPVFRHDDVRAQYNFYITNQMTISSTFLVSFWSFIIFIFVAVFNVFDGSVLSPGQHERYWQALALLLLVNLFVMVLLTMVVACGDGFIHRSIGRPLLMIGLGRASDLCHLREGLTVVYIISACLCQAVTLYLRSISEPCLDHMPLAQMPFCREASSSVSSPIPLDSLLVNIIFRGVYFQSFQQLKWGHYAVCWLIEFVLLVVTVLDAGLAGRSSHQSVPQSVVYLTVYCGSYVLMCMLHQSRLQTYISKVTQRRAKPASIGNDYRNGTSNRPSSPGFIVNATQGDEEAASLQVNGSESLDSLTADISVVHSLP
jgi:hypothetical protein